MPRKSSLSHALRDGGRFYFDDPTVDQVLAMVLTLSGQLWSVRERLAALESLLARRDAIRTGEVESHNFTDAEELELAALRKEWLASLFGILERPAPARATTQKKRGTRGSSRAPSPRASGSRRPKRRSPKGGRRARRSGR